MNASNLSRSTAEQKPDHDGMKHGAGSRDKLKHVERNDQLLFVTMVMRMDEGRLTRDEERVLRGDVRQR